MEAILHRLGCHTRTQAAVWAVTHGLMTMVIPQAADGMAEAVS